MRALTLAGVAGAHGINSSLGNFEYGTVVGSIGGFLATAMFFLFAIASVAPGCFSTFIAANSFATMLPGIPRLTSTMVAVTLAAALAITGIAANLVSFFTIVGHRLDRSVALWPPITFSQAAAGPVLARVSTGQATEPGRRDLSSALFPSRSCHFPMS